MRNTIAVCLIAITHLCIGQSKDFVDNEILVQFEKTIDHQSWIKDNSDIAQFNLKQDISSRLGIYLLSYQGATDASVISRLVNERAGVLISQVNHNGVKNRAVPNDQAYPVQWSLNMSAPGVSNAPLAWDISTGGYTVKGDRIVVAVVDMGFFLQHEDLNFYSNPNEIPNNNIDDDNNGYVDDIQGWNATSQTGIHPFNNHGTHVSGIVGAKGNNGIGVTGINWDVEVLPITSTSAVSTLLIQLISLCGVLSTIALEHMEF